MSNNTENRYEWYVNDYRVQLLNKAVEITGESKSRTIETALKLYVEENA